MYICSYIQKHDNDERERKEERNEEEEEKEGEMQDDQEKEIAAATVKCSFVDAVNPHSGIACSSQRKEVDLSMLI